MKLQTALHVNSYLEEYPAQAYLNNYYPVYARIAKSALVLCMVGEAFCSTSKVADSHSKK